ncbi:MAG: divalent-cation tolerance protein CutA [Aquabacterium sp.]|jgi:periplasmic divalent cation tolerance protein|uniref:divalent-cation tolerance protein CutA n=1 Tax=Aquabacterium sp. TaxID=1872578 RepID=UPI002A35D4A7|nr:divalent-cation tolerance protein CutA [Aquabacterium sp.]MDX9842319.1 divalent-cation tolerance protein CutA [Aquabacterium sp.]
MTLLAVFTTLPNAESARELAQMLVERGLVACAQIDVVDSIYRWDGAIQHDQEHRLMLKTTSERYPALEATICEHHPYELPAVYAVPVSQALPPYAEWVTAQTGP